MAQIHTQTPTISPTTSQPCNPPQQHGLNSMVLVAAIVCALLCALGLNTMLQCVFQCANRVLTEPLQWIASRRRNSGLKKKEMVALPTSIYNTHSPESPPPSLDSNCAICLAEFCDGDNMKLLPKCNHRFHVVCIDEWLLAHSFCPTCRKMIKSNDSVHCLSIVIS